MNPEIDCEALLSALVLAPSTYSRNRFFQLYQDVEVRRVRRRASIVRSLVKQFVRTAIEPVVSPLVSREASPEPEGEVEVVLAAPGLGFARRTILTGLELSLFRYMLARALGRPSDGERGRVEAALARLAGPVAMPTRADLTP